MFPSWTILGGMKKSRPPTRIGPKQPVRVYLAAWREHSRLSQSQLGARIGPHGVDKGTVSRWETSMRVPSTNVVAAYAEALGIPIGYLYRRPLDAPSLDELAAELPEAVRQQAIDYFEFLRRKA